MNVKAVLIAALAAFAAGGCLTKNVEIEVQAARPWEGRYETAKDAVAAAEKIDLGKGESVWLLSNSTLKRLLKTTRD